MSSLKSSYHHVIEEVDIADNRDNEVQECMSSCEVVTQTIFFLSQY